MYQIKSKILLKKAISINQIVKNSPMYRFYSCESGFILPGHKVEIISGVSVEIPKRYKAIVNPIIKKEKMQNVKCESYEIKSGIKTPLTIPIENKGEEAIQIEYGEPIGNLILNNIKID